MTKDEYLQLVQDSAVFKDLHKEVQQMILDAKEDQMPKYLALLGKANQTLENAKNNILTEGTKAIESIEKEIKAIKKDKLKLDERISSKNDKKVEESLLKDLNKY